MIILDKTSLLTKLTLSSLLLFCVGNLSAQTNYLGTGDEPYGLDHLLTYPNGQESMAFHMGGKRPFVIYYGSNIDPNTFVALLNDSDATRSFSPIPNTTETVYLHLKFGANNLQLSVKEKQYIEEELPSYLEINQPPSIDTDAFSIELKRPKTQVLIEVTPYVDSDIEENPELTPIHTW